MGGSIPRESVDRRESSVEDGNRQEEAQDERRSWSQVGEAGLNQWNSRVGEESDGHWQENIGQIWSQGTPSNEEEEDAPVPEVHEWTEDGTREAVDNWEEGSPVPSRRVNGFNPHDDDNVYSTELRELLSRSLALLFLPFSGAVRPVNGYSSLFQEKRLKSSSQWVSRESRQIDPVIYSEARPFPR